MTPLKDLLMTKQAAELLGLSPDTVRVYVMQGKIKRDRKFLGRLWFSRAELARFQAVRKPAGNPLLKPSR